MINLHTFNLKFFFTAIIFSLILSFVFLSFATGQCNVNSSFTKITYAGSSAVYSGTDGNSNVTVTATAAGSTSSISYCNIINGFRAGENDNNGSFKFSFSPKVNGIKLNINALSNIKTGKEKVIIKINGQVYNIGAENIVCTGNCFGCAGGKIQSDSNGAITAKAEPSGNGVGQILLQGVGGIKSIEYINKVQSGIPQGSVFEIFFNNSTCFKIAADSALKIKTGYVSSRQAINVNDSKINHVTILSNPIKDKLRLGGLTGINTINVYNAKGQKMADAKTSNNTVDIYANAWPVGVYFVHVNIGSTITTVKVLKQ